MQNKSDVNMTTIYKNPFDDYNANVLDPEMIMQYWYTPFSTGALKDLDEKKFYIEKMPIILQGSRGSGKTTILKYFSFPVQCERASRNKISIRKQLVDDAGIGFYFRCDDSFLKEFKSVFSIAVQERWTVCFEYYFELFFVKNLLEMIIALAEENENEAELIKEKIIKEAHLEQVCDDLLFDNIEELLKYISSEMRYINTFKNEALFNQDAFSPKHIWSMYEISGKLIEAISIAMPELERINYLLLVDEFENLPIELQKLFNTMMKFCKAGISMRVGRRSENIVTTETVNEVEYLREQHDYRLVILDQWQEIQALKPYLMGIATKRLEAFEGVDLPKSIIDILGEKEDLDNECQMNANSKNLHLKILLNSNPSIASNPSLLDEIISIISFPENRIAEMLNALWVSRCKKNDEIIEVAHNTVAAMRAFLDKGEHPLLVKYRNDYNGKYRYALTVLLCTAYKKDKFYYSFNTICYLSEGNARTFINLCKAILSDAFFYEKKQFLEKGRVSIESQCRAIRNYSVNEFNSVCAIIQDGKSIREFILSLGNIFSEYHKDNLVRYPETNQFTYNPDELPENIRSILDTAISWALIKRSKGTQRLSASIAKEGNLYRINRIFVPIFNISFRTRGGVNVVLDAEEINEMVLGTYKRSKLNGSTTKKKANTLKKKDNESNCKQLSLFDLGGTE